MKLNKETELKFIEEFEKQNCSIKNTIEKLDINLNTFNRYRQKNEDFKQLLEDAKAKKKKTTPNQKDTSINIDLSDLEDTTKRSRTTITSEVLKMVKEMAGRGFSNVMISQTLNISTSTLSTNIELKKSIQKGKLDLATNLSTIVIESLKSDKSMRQFLVKRLGLFNQHVDIKTPKNAKDALENLSTATKQYSEGLISESQLRTIEAVSNSYIKSYDSILLEERITALEKRQS